MKKWKVTVRDFSPAKEPEVGSVWVQAAAMRMMLGSESQLVEWVDEAGDTVFVVAVHRLMQVKVFPLAQE